MDIYTTVIKVGGLPGYNLHKKMHVPCREYKKCCPVVWRVLAFDFTLY